MRNSTAGRDPRPVRPADPHGPLLAAETPDNARLQASEAARSGHDRRLNARFRQLLAGRRKREAK